MKKTYKHPTIKVKPIETADFLAASITATYNNARPTSDTNENCDQNNFAKSNSIWYGDDEESSQN